MVKYIPSGFSMSTISSFKDIENTHDLYRGKVSMKMFCELLRQHVVKIINFEKKKIRSLTKEQQESNENAKIYPICKKRFEDKYAKDKKYCKVRDHYHYTGQYRGAALYIAYVI